MKTISRIVDKICTVFGYISAASMAFIMLWMFYDLCRRIFANAPMTGGYEVSCMIMSILTFTSWSYTQSCHGHIHVTMFLNKMPGKVRHIIFAITSWLSTFTLGVMTYACFLYILKMKKVTAMLLIPYKPFVIIMCISVFVFAVALLRDAVKAVIAIWNKDMAEEIESNF